MTYEEVIKLDIQLPPEMEHVMQDLPDSQVNKRVLYFNESAALLKDPEEGGDQTIDMEGEGGMMRFRVQRDENETYFDFDKNLRIQKRDFMGRIFLIDGEVSRLPWRLTDDRSEFLGYMCQKAVAMADSSTYEAWFTPKSAFPPARVKADYPDSSSF